MNNTIPIFIELYTGLTLNYSFQSNEYRECFYPILKELLFLNKKGQLPISGKKLQKLIKHKTIPLTIVNEILNELHYYSVLYKGHSVDEKNTYGFAF